jgi:hypothetical protein
MSKPRQVCQQTAENGVTFTVTVVFPGDSYGLHFCLVNEKETMIEFYDSRYPHTEFGQFVARYYLSTLMHDRHWDRGLCLHGGVPGWEIDGSTMLRTMKSISDWLVIHAAEGARSHECV